VTEGKRGGERLGFKRGKWGDYYWLLGKKIKKEVKFREKKGGAEGSFDA